MNLKETLKLEAINRTKERIRFRLAAKRYNHSWSGEFTGKSEYSKALYNHYCQQLGFNQS